MTENHGGLKEIKKMYQEDKIDVYIEKKDNNYIINYDENNEESATASLIAQEYLEQYKLSLQDSYLRENKIDSNEVFNIMTISYNKIGSKEDIQAIRRSYFIRSEGNIYDAWKNNG